MSTDGAPVDKSKAVHLTFILWGMSVMLPRNAVMACFDFFHQHMLGYKPEFVFPFALSALLASTNCVMIVYGHHLSPRVKTQYTFALSGVLMLSLPVLAYCLDPTPAFYSCFFVLVVFGLLNGVLYSGIYGFAAFLPPKYMAAVMYGQGIIGILTCSLRMLFAATFPEDSLYLQALIFFSLACVFYLGCAISFSYLEQNEFFKYY